MSNLKDIYSTSFYDKFADHLAIVVPAFDKALFIKQIFSPDFEEKALKERMRHTAVVLHQFLPADFPVAVDLLRELIAVLRGGAFSRGGLEFMFLPDYIELYGLNDYHNAVKAFEFITQFISCEFAVRPFILKYETEMLAQMEQWSLHQSAGVRRLSSEGSRPRLPWAMAIPSLKKNPQPLFQLLENLKNDPSESVRRSVANNLNDIAKDHPDVVIDIAGRWKGLTKETDAIVKHGCRTLLKQGHTAILAHYGLATENIELSDFKILTPQVKIGESLSFSFSICNKQAASQVIRLEYGVFYQRQKGQLNKKVFKISERRYAGYQQETITRRQKFIVITTRKYYPGKHQLSIIINGKEMSVADFELSTEVDSVKNGLA